MNLNCPNDIYHQRGKPALKKEGEHRIESPNTLRHSSPPSSSTERATSLWRSSMLTPIASNRIIERKQEARCSPEAKQSTARRSSDKSADEEEEEGDREREERRGRGGEGGGEGEELEECGWMVVEEGQALSLRRGNYFTTMP